MPRVTAPLFSLTASGTLGATITYLNTTTRQVVRYKIRKHSKRSTLQIIHGERIAASRAAWRHLSAQDAAPWRAKAAIFHMTGPALWAREWFAQNIYPPAVPQLPL